MSVNIYGLYSRAENLSTHFKSFLWVANRKERQQHALIKDIVSSLGSIRLPNGRSVLNEEIEKIKLKGNYSRKLVVQVFSKLGLTVTRYTREYGRTIVHFEDASDS